jgi:D-alanyl-D-alanine endopeptidase (penicillin-binding protein 7)
VVIVLLDSWGKYTRLGDANRIRHWLEANLPPAPATIAAPVAASAPGSSRAPNP